jgi:hypothetical protein
LPVALLPVASEGLHPTRAEVHPAHGVVLGVGDVELAPAFGQSLGTAEGGGLRRPIGEALQPRPTARRSRPGRRGGGLDGARCRRPPARRRRGSAPCRGKPTLQWPLALDVGTQRARRRRTPSSVRQRAPPGHRAGVVPDRRRDSRCAPCAVR